MNTLESIFIAIIFFIPGFFVQMVKDLFFQKSKKKYSDFERTIKSIIISLIIIFLNIIIIDILRKIFNLDIIWDISKLQEKLKDIVFLIKWLC